MGSMNNYIFKLIRIIGDILTINFMFYLAFFIRFRGDISASNFAEYLSVIPYITIGAFIVFELYNLYSDQLKKDLAEITYAIIPASVIIIILSIAFSFFFRAFSFPRSIFLITLILMIPALTAWRILSIRLEKKFSIPSNVVIIGAEREISKILNNIRMGTNGSYNISGVVLTSQLEELQEADFSIYVGLDNLDKKLSELNPDLIFLATELAEKEKKELFHLSLKKDWNVMLVPDFYEIMLSGSRLTQIGELPVYEVQNMRKNERRIVKRLIDIAISLTGLIISLPLTILVALAIKIDSPGPVFFRQQRMSKDGTTFKVIKFRTMVRNAEAKTGPVLCDENDTRVTRIGNILRKTRIDEIPQLINVLKGEMSLIGPRPERPCFVEEFENDIPEYKYRHRIKTGITGLAQVYGYYSSDPEDKLRLDLLYANKSSFVFDLKIMLETVKVMLMGHRKAK